MELPKEIEDLQGLPFYNHRRVWRSFMREYDCRKVAEIGVFRGENFKRMVEHGPELAVAVDLWKDTGIVAQNDCGFSQEVLDEMMDDFIKKWDKPWVKIHRELTAEAAKHYPDGFFDLIYIDADHTYEGCKADLEAWWPKVKKGKFFTGDDFSDMKAPNTGVRFGVKQAVKEFCKKNNLTYYVLPARGWAIIK